MVLIQCRLTRWDYPTPRSRHVQPAQMAQWLLDKGVDPNPIYDGKTPLAMSLENNQTELVQILRTHGGIG